MSKLDQYYCSYREHLYQIGDLVYLQDDPDNEEVGKYCKIISFKNVDKIVMFELESVSEYNGSNVLMPFNYVSFPLNVYPAEHIINDTIIDLRQQVKRLTELKEQYVRTNA